MPGKLYIVGGNMSTAQDEIFTHIVRDAGGANARIALIVTASGSEPDDTYRSYQKDFAKVGLNPDNLVLIPLYPENELDERSFNAINGDHPCLPPLFEGVTGVWFTGGDQYHTNRAFIRPDGTDTKALEILRRIYENGGIIGGSSAGAAIMSHVMICCGTNRGTLSKAPLFSYDTYEALSASDDPDDPLMLDCGLGFFKDGIVDQHFNRRPRMLRLMEACMINPEKVRVGYGISESTALVYDNGALTVLGLAGVYIVDCRNAEKTAEGIANVTISAIQKGDKMDARTLEITLSGERNFVGSHCSFKGLSLDLRTKDIKF